MIKIIKEGNPHRVVRLFYKKTCPVCGCEFEFNDDDINVNGYFDKNINCPCCDNTIGIDIGDIGEIREVDR